MIRPFVFAALLAVAFPAFAEDMAVVVGKVATISSDAPPGTVVIGNPAIADVAVEGRTIIVFGKAVGETDLVVFDENREILMAHRVVVGSLFDSDSVTVIAPGGQGTTAVRWNCAEGGGCVKVGGK